MLSPSCPLAPDPGAARRGRVRSRVIVAGMLAVYALLAFTASLSKGPSFDEGLQLALGYNVWLHADHRVEGANGDFVKRWATLPYLLTRPAFPAREDPRWRNIDSYELGRAFFFDLGNRPAALLREARGMMTLLGIATGVLVYGAARRIFGARGGWVALAIFITSPHFLAFGAIVSTDLPVTLMLFGATLGIWEVLHRLTPLRLAFSLGAVGLLFLAKMTALVIVPITAVLVAVRLAAGGPLHLAAAGRTATVTSRRGVLAVAGVLLIVHTLAGWGAVWAHYNFRYDASPVPGIAVAEPVEVDGAAADVARWARRAGVLPEGYCAGIEWLLATCDQLPAFMAGRSKLGGWLTFFPYAIWVKTSPSLFLLLALGAVVAFRGWRRAPAPAGNGAGQGGRWYQLTPHVTLIVVYLAVAVTEDINIGHRHVLPIYPPLFVLAGAAGWAWRARTAVLGLLLGALLVWRVGEVAAIRPHFLAYFAPQVGGAAAGHRLLVDSSLDWGMDLPSLKQWLAQHNPGGRVPVFLGYFGTDSPRSHGIECVRLPGFRPRQHRPRYALTPGFYAISATLLSGSYLPTFGRWNPQYERVYQQHWHNVRLEESAAADPVRRADLLARRPESFWRDGYISYDYFRFGRLCSWLRRKGPAPLQIGHSILVWRLTEADLRAALQGPPPELHEAPAEWLKLTGGGGGTTSAAPPGGNGSFSFQMSARVRGRACLMPK